MNRPDVFIEVSRLSKTYGNGAGAISVLKDVDLRIHKREMVAITGPSGCGKSTLLFILGLFLAPSEGSYFFSGRNVLDLGRSSQAEFRRKQIGFVFQTADLLEKSTVYENLEFPLIYARVGRERRQDMIVDALRTVNLEHRIRHPSNQLSGGEKQRVAIARALVNKPQVILADEPTGQLDRKNSQTIMDHFEKIVAEGETAVLIVTHDREVAARCDRVCTLEDGVIRGENG